MADQLVRATAADGGIRVVGVISTRLCEEARSRHKLSVVAAAALGRTMSAGLLLASSMKQPEARVNVRIEGNGPLGGILVDAGTDGTVRGYVQNPDVELPPKPNGKLDVGGAVGKDGYLYVVRDTRRGYPYSSTVELVSGEIGEDVASYLVKSEQTPSALVLGVFVDRNGVRAAGGLLLQVLPKVAEDETLIEALEARISALSGFTPLLRSHHNLPEIFKEVLGDFDLKVLPGVQMVRFHCGCTRSRFLGALKMLGRDELEDMIEKDGGAEGTCNFCAEVYRTDRDGLHGLVAELQQEEAERRQQEG